MWVLIEIYLVMQKSTTIVLEAQAIFYLVNILFIERKDVINRWYWVNFSSDFLFKASFCNILSNRWDTHWTARHWIPAFSECTCSAMYAKQELEIISQRSECPFLLCIFQWSRTLPKLHHTATHSSGILIKHNCIILFSCQLTIISLRF